MRPVPLAAAGPIAVVSFDAGGTLLAPWPSVGTVYAQIAARHGAPNLDTDALDQRFATVWQQHRSRFAFTRDAWQELVADAFAGIHTVGRDPRFFAELYDHFATAAPWTVFDDVAPTLAGLQRMGLRLAVTSNWDDRLPEVLRATGLAGFFEVVIASGVVGIHKPAPELFRITADRLGVPAAAMLHVGDEEQTDFNGAHAAGCPAVIVSRTPGRDGRQAAAVIGSLRELLPPIRDRRKAAGPRSSPDYQGAKTPNTCPPYIDARWQEPFTS